MKPRAIYSDTQRKRGEHAQSEQKSAPEFSWVAHKNTQRTLKEADKFQNQKEKSKKF
ncbi:hypothetical protein BT93_A0669 [Corymbia citriodora subsp. variegata]|nr:hypothetical protein BT93_A0669 [Corymbia citriodora subsp. variegata]